MNSDKTPVDLTPLPIVEGVDTIKKKSTLLQVIYITKKSSVPNFCIFQVIDTTLLKCYLQTNDALVASLLRLKDNNCHLVEAERVLKKASKFTELVRPAKFA